MQISCFLSIGTGPAVDGSSTAELCQHTVPQRKTLIGFADAYCKPQKLLEEMYRNRSSAHGCRGCEGIELTARELEMSLQSVKFGGAWVAAAPPSPAPRNSQRTPLEPGKFSALGSDYLFSEEGA